jgi:ADP-ribose pyrophosphatase
LRCTNIVIGGYLVPLNWQCGHIGKADIVHGEWLVKEVADLFEYCPRCGVETKKLGENPYCCANCDWTFYFNPAVSAGAVLLDSAGSILLLERARNPGKGELGIPGGFIDLGESAEAALKREVHEEVGLTLKSFEFLCSFPNHYPYRDVCYEVVDLFFVGRVDSFAGIVTQESEVAGCVIVEPQKIPLGRIAFDSIRSALEMYQQRVAN